MGTTQPETQFVSKRIANVLGQAGFFFKDFYDSIS